MFTAHIYEKSASSTSLLFTREVECHNDLCEIYRDFRAGHYDSYVDDRVTGWSTSRHWDSDDFDLYIETERRYY